jgi:hypothetical protein
VVDERTDRPNAKLYYCSLRLTTVTKGSSLSKNRRRITALYPKQEHLENIIRLIEGYNLETIGEILHLLATYNDEQLEQFIDELVKKETNRKRKPEEDESSSSIESNHGCPKRSKPNV